MKFKTRQDVETGIDNAFAACADFRGLERQALRNGIDLERTGTGAPGQPGGGDDPLATAWTLRFDVKGRKRVLNAAVQRFEVPEGYDIAGRVDGLEIALSVDLLALSKNRTRMTVSVDLAPRTMTARLLVHSLKLAKGNLQRRFAARVEAFALSIEGRG